MTYILTFIGIYVNYLFDLALIFVFNIKQLHVHFAKRTMFSYLFLLCDYLLWLVFLFIVEKNSFI